MIDDRPRKIEALRAVLRDEGLDALIVPSADEYLNEYLPPEAERRAYVSGFHGSAGHLVVSLQDAWLFTDSRYHLQADRELEGSGITNVKLGQGPVRDMRSYLARLSEDRGGWRVGFPAQMFSTTAARRLRATLGAARGSLVPLPHHPVDTIWHTRPAPRRAPLIEVPREFSGTSPEEKVMAVQERLRARAATDLLVCKLDQIAWLTNLRGTVEVPYNPVFPARAHLAPDGLHLFLDDALERVPADWMSARDQVQVHPIEQWEPHLQTLTGTVLCDPDSSPAAVFDSLTASESKILEAPSPIEELKARKNPSEAECMRRANALASLAKTRSLLWLRRELSAGRTVSEGEFAQHLEQRYAELPDYLSLSFSTISATGPNSADVHYSDCGPRRLAEGDLFLIDSGCHVAGGTTDDTRTIAIGAPPPDAKRLYTTVLEGHIAAARQRLPIGAHGSTLDALARAPLWNSSLDFGHGTGHGVGAFLNVHEGPFSISGCRPHSPSAGLEPGHVFSIEPGYYAVGYGGIRLENLYLARQRTGDPSSRWMDLECLTWIPFEPRLIDSNLLSAPARAWLDSYHSACRDHLLPHLDAAEVRELEHWLTAG